MTKYLIGSLLLIAFLFMPSTAYAQMETKQSTQSLGRIQGFYVRVEIEGSVGLTSDEKLNVKAINQRVKRRLRDAGLNVIEPTEGFDQPMEPYLYVHINMMELEQGLVPFANNLQFFQRVEIPGRRRKQSLIAATWDTGVVGLVSYDNLDMIADSAIESVNEFITDFQQVNP